MHLQLFLSISIDYLFFNNIKTMGDIWKSHISNKDSAANPASLQTMDDLIGDVGVAHQAGRDIDHGAIWSRAHPIHVHAIHSTHTSHSSMAPWRASATLPLVDFPLSNDTIGILSKSKET